MTNVPMLLPPDFSRLTSLTDLTLIRMPALPWEVVDEAQSTLNLAQAVSNLTNLCTLTIGDIVENVPAQFSRLQRLTGLRLDRFEEEWPLLFFPTALQQCRHLCSIQFQGCVSDDSYEGWLSICQSLQAFPHLRELVLEDMDFSGVSPNSWAFQPKLTRLSMFNCNLQALPTAITGLASLRWLYFNDNRIQDIPPGPYLQRLTFLGMAWNALSAMPQALESAKSLQEISFEEELDEQPWFDLQHIRNMLPVGCHIEIIAKD